MPRGKRRLFAYLLCNLMVIYYVIVYYGREEKITLPPILFHFMRRKKTDSRVKYYGVCMPTNAEYALIDLNWNYDGVTELI